MEYEDCIVSFVDVLGFRSHLNSKTPTEIAALLNVLRSATSTETPVGPERRMKDYRMISEVVIENISDAVVRIRTIQTQYQDGAFFHELMDLLHGQIDCISQGVLIRAGVTIGEMHIGLDGDGPVFGPALVRAYDLESGEVIFPRIAVEETAIERFENDPSLWREGNSLEEEKEFVDRLITTDDAGLCYIDYLRASEAELDSFENYLDFLTSHRHLISEGLSAGPTKGVLRKYRWLQNYHNKVVQEIRGRVSSDLNSVDAFNADNNVDFLQLVDELIVD